MGCAISLAPAAVKPIAEKIVGCLWDSNARRVNYIKKFKDNHKELIKQKDELVALRDDVKGKVEVEELELHVKRTSMVVLWFKNVKEFEQEVVPILRDCSDELPQKCCGDCCPKNWRARYRLGKTVHKKLLKTVRDLISQGRNSDLILTEKNCPPKAEKQEPEITTVGMDETFEKVWGLLGDDAVKVIGIYGMGGIGKTTLLMKINNTFLLEGGALAAQANTFDMVIWVDVPRQSIPESIHSLETVQLESARLESVCLESIQKQIVMRLGLTWSADEDEEHKARRILHMLSQKKVLVLFDGVWKSLKLEAIGIPSQNSKVLFTTRSEKVCQDMQYNEKLKMPLLSEDFSLDLFKQSIGDKVLNSHSEFPGLAKKVAEECCGLPLALIIIGKAMITKGTVEEWNCAIETLKYYASQFSEMREKVLAILKFSYDALTDKNVRNCFLYFSLYPEDCEISIGEIVQRWIGEGFLDISYGMDRAVSDGRHIISSLMEACLLEGDRRECFVKMHGVVRDLALWIGREGNKMFVEAGLNLIQMPDVEESWTIAERISLMDNGIKELTGAPECPHLLTLVLQLNNTLSTILPDFFTNMSTLRVLDLSQTNIRNIPKSIGKLCQLKFLNLSDTNIETLPDELENLVNLNHLNLDTNGPIRIPDWVILHFARMLVLFSGSALPGDGNRTDSVRAHNECRRYLKALRDSMKVPVSPPYNYRNFIKSVVILRCQGLGVLESSSFLKLIRVRQLGVQDIQYGESENHSGQSRKRYGFKFDFAKKPSVLAAETTSVSA